MRKFTTLFILILVSAASLAQNFVQPSKATRIGKISLPNSLADISVKLGQPESADSRDLDSIIAKITIEINTLDSTDTHKERKDSLFQRIDYLEFHNESTFPNDDSLRIQKIKHKYLIHISGEIDSIKILRSALILKVSSLPERAIYNARLKHYREIYHGLTIQDRVFIPTLCRPVLSKIYYEMMYSDSSTVGELSLLNSSSFTLGNNSGSVFIETISDNFGPVRARFGNMITASSADSAGKQTKDIAIQKLMSNGGNVLLSFDFPLIWVHSRNQKFNYVCNATFGGAADFPVFGTTTPDWAGNIFYGLNMVALYQSDKKKVGLIADYNLVRHDGNQIYKDNLGVKSTFFYGQATLGVIINNTFKLSFALPNLTNIKSFRNTKTTAGGQLMKTN
jgi:hypothetical protein